MKTRSKNYARMPGIRARRLAQGLSVPETAEALGVQKATWYDWEAGKYVPSAALLPAMARLLGCGIAELYEAPPGGDGEGAGAT